MKGLILIERTTIMLKKMTTLLAVATLTGCIGTGKKEVTEFGGKGRRARLQTYGYLEPVQIFNDKYGGVAKLDTGADNCSLGAVGIKEFERDGKRWVKFKIDKRLLKGRKGDGAIERKVKRVTSIKRHGSEPMERFVIMLDMHIGEVHQEVEFNLTDRSHYNYPILVGRNYLNGQILVDSEKSKTLKEK